MTHISAERVIELSIAAGVASREEQEHLDRCDHCRSSLAEEIEFTASLAAILPSQAIPEGFAARTTARYARAIGRKRLLLALLTFTGVLAAALAAIVVCAVALVITGPAIVDVAGVAVAQILTVARATSTVARHLPLLSLLLPFSSCAAVLLWTFVLTQLARRAEVSL